MNLILNFTTLCHADSHFEGGINAFQKGDFDQAHTEFENLSKVPSNRFAALYNLGNTAIKQKKPGMALAYYRLAEKINPKDKDLKYNIRYTLQEFKILPVSGNISSYEVLRSEILDLFSFWDFSILAAIIFFGFAYFFIENLKKNHEDRTTKTPFKIYVFGILLILSLGLMTIKIIDSFQSRGTIITPKAELKSGPGVQNATLTEAQEGNEVYIRDSVTNDSGTWKQVTIPGNLTGWISEQSVIQTSGEGPF